MVGNIHSKFFEYMNHTLYCLQGKSISPLIKFLMLSKIELYQRSVCGANFIS